MNKAEINAFFDGMRQCGANYSISPGDRQEIENERQEQLSELARKPTEEPGRSMYALDEGIEAVARYFDAKEGGGEQTACMVRLIKPSDLEEFLP